MVDTATIQDQEAPAEIQETLDALGGIEGMDSKSLTDKVKEEAAAGAASEEAKPVEGAVEATPEEEAATAVAAKEAATAVETSTETPAAVPEEVKITITENIAIGDEVKAGEAAAPDGDYPRADKSILVVKDGKVESIKPAEGAETPAPAAKTGDHIDNPFVSQEAAAVEVTNIKNFDEGAGYLTEKLGMEIKTPADLAKVATRVEELNTSLSGLQEEKGNLENYKAVFENLPDELFSPVRKWLDGEDYHAELQVVSRMNLDFSKPFSSHDVESMLDHYHPGKFSKEDYQDLADDKAFLAVVDSTKQLYTADQNRFKGQKEDYKKTTEATQKKYGQSVEASITSLAADVPYIKAHHKQKVEGILKTGEAGILNLFVDSDGMLKPEAGKYIALAIYGEAAISAQSKSARNKGESAAREEILIRTPTKQEKASAAAGAAPDTAGHDVLQAFQKEVIPSEGGDNPFMKPFTGD